VGQLSGSDVVIIGGGVVGCALAYDLTRRNVSVTLLERRELAREASWASAGIISLPTPGYQSKIDLALLSFRRYPELVADVEAASGISTGRAHTGMVHVATDQNVDKLQDTMRWQESLGLSSEWLDRTALREREPAIHESFVGGVYHSEVMSLLLGQFALALARTAEQNGAIIRQHCPALGIDVDAGKVCGVRTIDGVVPADTVVVAAGAWSKLFSGDVGLSIPTYPVRGQMIAISDPPTPLNSVINGEGGYLVPRADGSIAVGATEEHEAGFDAQVTSGGVAWLAALIDRLTPSLNNGRLTATWAGLRPGSADGELIVGKVPSVEGVWIASGHFRSGALLAPGTSQILADSIVSNQVDSRLEAFDPGRFLR
jgi:glycine oxidase